MFGALIFLELFALVFLIGQFFLQYFLSTRQAKWPGLIFPVLSLLWGLVNALNATTIPAAAAAFVLGGGLPFVLHFALYRLGRSRLEKKNRDRIEKMNIQDL
ncbi:MAG: hypothetical protein HFF11_02900 [Angelakisella sp.]|jgi:hypothetical protein|nr:hypothetical protein [Angelakisella sp.]